MGSRHPTRTRSPLKVWFFYGTIMAAEPRYTSSDWTMVNAMLVSWIMNIDPHVKGILTKYREAKRLWDHLKTRFGAINGPLLLLFKNFILRLLGVISQNLCLFLFIMEKSFMGGIISSCFFDFL